MPAIGINWHYHDLVSIFKKIKERGYNLVYLTARTFSDYSGTRKYIEELGHKDHKLPRGPILMYPKSFINVLRTDLVTKTADVNQPAHPGVQDQDVGRSAACVQIERVHSVRIWEPSE